MLTVYVLQMQLVKMVQVAHIPQIAIFGRISHFDWSAMGQVPVLWILIGCGQYALQNVDTPPDAVVPPNRALGIYMNEYAQIQPSPCSEVNQQQNTSISKPVFSYDPIRLPVARGSRGMT